MTRNTDPHAHDAMAPSGCTERGLTITIDYVIGLAVLVVISSLFLTAITDVQTQREQQVTQAELERVTTDIAAQLQQVEATAYSTTAQAAPQTGHSGKTIISITDVLPDESVTISVTTQPTGSPSNTITLTAQANDISHTKTLTLDSTTTVTTEGFSTTNTITVTYTTPDDTSTSLTITS